MTIMNHESTAKQEPKSYLAKSISYEQYLKDIERIAQEQTDENFAYYSINLTRMQRILKTLKIDEQSLQQLKNIQKPVTLLAITEGWCGDAAQILPVIAGMVEISNQLSLRVVYRDENPELMNQYLTHGTQSIPIIIGMDQSGQEIFKYGPRPGFGTPILQAYKNGEMSKEEFLLTLQKTYTRDKGVSIVKELIELLKKQNNE